MYESIFVRHSYSKLCILNLPKNASMFIDLYIIKRIHLIKRGSFPSCGAFNLVLGTTIQNKN